MVAQKRYFWHGKSTLEVFPSFYKTDISLVEVGVKVSELICAHLC